MANHAQHGFDFLAGQGGEVGSEVKLRAGRSMIICEVSRVRRAVV